MMLTRAGQIEFTRSIGGARTLTATIATETPTVVLDRSTGRAVLEVLVIGGAVLPDSIPMLVDHQRSIPTTVGSARDFAVERSSLIASLSFASTPAADDVFALVSQRHVRALSVGYSIIEDVPVAPGRSVTIMGRTYTAPVDNELRVVTKWRLREVSVVPIGADPGATFRSSLEGENMRTAPQVIAEVPHETYADLFKCVLRSDGARVPDNEVMIVREGLSSVTGFDALNATVNSTILDSYRGAPDSTVGWVRTVPLPNYLLQKVSFTETAVRLSKHARGGSAAHVSFGVAEATGWRLAKFSCQLAIDEQDMIDNADLGMLRIVLAEIGAAARRIVPDLVWALILDNPEIADGTDLFHADHANLGSSPIDATSLAVARGAIGSQLRTDHDGDPVHIGLDGRYLIVPPAKYQGARSVARDSQLGDGSDLIVRSESRLNTVGVVDPGSGEIVAGNSLNWLLAAPSAQAAGICVGLLDGKAEPTIRVSRLDQGRFGVHVDCQFSCGVIAVDHRPLYFSVGQ